MPLRAAVPPWEATSAPLPATLRPDGYSSAIPDAGQSPSPAKASSPQGVAHGEDCSCAACETHRTFHSLLRGSEAAAPSKRPPRASRQKPVQPDWDSTTEALPPSQETAPRPRLRLMKWKGDGSSGQEVQGDSGRPAKSGPHGAKHRPLPEWNTDIDTPLSSALDGEPPPLPAARRRRPAAADSRHGRAASVDVATRPSEQAGQAPGSAPAGTGTRRVSRSQSQQQQPQRRAQAEWNSDVAVAADTDNMPEPHAARKPPPANTRPPSGSARRPPDGYSSRQSQSTPEVPRSGGCPKCGRDFSGRALVMHLKNCTAGARPKNDPFEEPRGYPEHNAGRSVGSRDKASTPKGAARRQRDEASAQREASPPLPARQPQQAPAQRAASPSMPARRAQQAQAQRPASPPLPARQAQQGAVERPPSPPIPAVAAAQAQAPPEEQETEPLEPCPHCGRTFRMKALQRHMTICQKVFQEKRKAFDAVAQAVPTEAVKAKKTHDRQAKKESKKDASSAKANDASAGAAPSWQKKSEAFREAIKQARIVDKFVKEGRSLKDLPPPAATDPALDDRTQCPHCGRRFGSTQAARHIPLCATKSKKKGR
eukprot:TRINITY_DN31531_c0_g1_i2.p1 TRINITY_DN31531_c0_g1~~TRINITY_DN31531_c0_g1_i2.p1  ORF type:complete len:596 (+),score=115.81 TRINITY_DN31531_c0_g1_i2:87-1874(+)